MKKKEYNMRNDRVGALIARAVEFNEEIARLVPRVSDDDPELLVLLGEHTMAMARADEQLRDILLAMNFEYSALKELALGAMNGLTEALRRKPPASAQPTETEKEV